MLAVVAMASTARSARAADPDMPACLAANETSIKLRTDHKLKQAREQSLVCASASCPDIVRDRCRKRASDLTSAIPTLVLLAKDADQHDIVSVAVSMDGEPLTDHLDGTGIAVDPGQHTLKFVAPGQPTVERTFVIGEGEKDRREVVVFGGGAPPGAPVDHAARDASVLARRHNQQIAAFASGAGGVVALVVGGVMGGLASSEWSDAKNACNGQPVSCTTSPSSKGAMDESSASSKATVSTTMFIIGGVLAAAGVTLYLTAPAAPETSAPARGVGLEPAGAPGGGGVVLRGWF